MLNLPPTLLAVAALLPLLTAGVPLHTSSLKWPPDGFKPVNPNAPPPSAPVNNTSERYVSNGKLHKPEPMPHMPAGGLGTDPKVPPVYNPMSDFDFQSLNLALNTEWMELDLFYYAIKTFSKKDFKDAGLNDDDVTLIKYMGDQEIGHAQVITNMLGPHASWPCTYQYPFNTVKEFIDFSQKVTRAGESGTVGFIPHLDSRAAAQMLIQSITVESRQQAVFRQFQGLFTMPFWHVPGVTQSMQWSLMAPYIKSCPSHNPHIEWQNFPALKIMNNPNGTDPRYGPAITHNRPPLTKPGREVKFEWEDPGKLVGPNNSYVTSTTAGSPRWAAWISQLNTTYTPLYNVKGNTGSAKQPAGFTWENDPAANGTMFVLLTDSNPVITPANVSALNAHVRAGPALYQAG